MATSHLPGPVRRERWAWNKTKRNQAEEVSQLVFADVRVTTSHLTLYLYTPAKTSEISYATSATTERRAFRIRYVTVFISFRSSGQTGHCAVNVNISI